MVVIYFFRYCKSYIFANSPKFSGNFPNAISIYMYIILSNFLPKIHISSIKGGGGITKETYKEHISEVDKLFYVVNIYCTTDYIYLTDSNI